MANIITFDWFLNHTNSNASFEINYLTIFNVISNLTSENAGGQPEKKRDLLLPLSLAAHTLSLAVYILALSSRSQFQLNCLKHGLLFWAKSLSDACVTLVALSVLAPTLLVLGTALATYRKLVATFLQRSLLNGADAVSALDYENQQSREIVCILVLLNGELSLQQLREITRSRFLPSSKKLRLNRAYSALGYFYWQPTSVDVSSRVRLLTGCKEGEEMSEDDLRNIISAVSNEPLPESHAAGWEVLLGPRLRTTPDDDAPRTALLFRVHHSVGDGPALCRLFISAVADSRGQQAAVANIMTAKMQRSRQHPSLLRGLRDATAGWVAQIAPADQNCLHGGRLSGDKHVAWRGSPELLAATKHVRATTGATFTAVLLAALTSAVAEYQSSRGTTTQLAQHFTVVVPARLPSRLSRQEKEDLTNSFTFGLVRTLIPYASSSALIRIHAAESALRAACQPTTLLVNRWTLNLASELLPYPLAKRVLYSDKCTAVLSNMPGPASAVTVAGRNVSDVIFFVPHRGTTGVGASALSYAGKLTLGLAIDGALLTTPEDVHHLTCAWERHVFLLENTLCSHV